MKMDLDDFLCHIQYFIEMWGVHLLDAQDKDGRYILPEGFREDMERELAAINLGEINAQLKDIRDHLEKVPQPKEKEWYSVHEVAAIVKRRPWTVRDWCRKGRIDARKRIGVGRGNTEEWEISQAALDYYLNHRFNPRSGQ